MLIRYSGFNIYLWRIEKSNAHSALANRDQEFKNA